MKIIYNVFHLDRSLQRQKYVEAIHSCLGSHYEKLVTPTISISNQDEVTAFLTENPEFKLDGNGSSDPTGTQGWMFGEIGIWASNYFAWKNFLETDADFLILVEDDLILSKRFIEIFNIYLSQLPEDWDMFTAYVPPGHYAAYNETHDVGIELLCKAYQDWSLAFYVINRQSAEKLLQSVSEGVVYPPDWHFYKQPEKFNVYAPKPQDAGFCSLSGADSTYQFRDTRAPLEGNI